jgi:hypothetical protein
MATSAVPASTYQPKSFDKNKYDVSSYQYPSDLMGQEARKTITTDSSLANKYGNNYVVFYINVNNESKMLKNPDGTSTGTKTVDIDLSERVKKGLAGKQYTEKEVVIAQTAGGAIAGTAVGGALGLGGGGGVAGAAVGGIGAAAVAGSTQNSTFSRPQKRLQTAIALHVPNQLSIKYGANYSDEETFGMQALIDGGEAVGRALTEAGKALANNDKAGAASAINSNGKTVTSIVANAALSKGPGGATMSAMTGLAPNPMKEQVFKGVDFRTFTMDYQFAPRDEAEARNVLKIIQAFKYHMHPEYKDAGNFLFLYPSEFDITYFHGGEENLNIHRHTSCVLTDMDVNYTPNGNFSTFKGGMPTQINMTLSFKELTILTKELIAQGL